MSASRLMVAALLGLGIALPSEAQRLAPLAAVAPQQVDVAPAVARGEEWSDAPLAVRSAPRDTVPVRELSRTGAVIGGLFFGHPEPGVFTGRAERIVVGVAAQAAVAIDNARLYESAQKAAEERKVLLESERAARNAASVASSEPCCGCDPASRCARRRRFWWTSSAMLARCEK